MYLFTVSKRSLVIAGLSLAAITVSLPSQAKPLERSTTERPAAIQIVQPDEDPGSRPHTPTNPILHGNGCPEGTQLIIWNQPIYDEEGLFVVDHEPTPYCIDEDFEPAG